MVNRLLVAIVLIPIGVAFIAAGGVAYSIFVTAILGIAAWEYSRLFLRSGACPSTGLIITGVALLSLSRAFLQFRWADLLLSLLVLIAMAFHLVGYERGRERSAMDFAITVTGILYLGWIGSYLISLRQLADGNWWVLTALPAVWIGDAAAMVVGKRFGKHLLSPHLSPKKTWEGYFGGLIGSTAWGALAGTLWSLLTPALTVGRGALLGLALGVVSIFGDLGESMIKRQAGVKDSSNILPGHGGVFDRIDSWLWAGVVGYYLVSVLW
ncbi:MAG: phosphatidate cytidylyltransferase [Anaerolineaceae bacterium]|nr:phosphatidate cytidylyltransferase [Anaerolineaceae bacterium]